MTTKKADAAKRPKHDEGPPEVQRRQHNRTGAHGSPGDARAQREAAVRFPPSSPGDGSPLALHALCLEDERRAAAMGAGGRATVLLDKLAERLTFERAGTRLYEGLLVKLEAIGTFEGGPSRDDLASFLEEELTHFHQVREAIEQLGGDPTAMTPSANVSAVIGRGLPLVILDPHGSLADALHAIHVAELADNDGWQMLIALTEFMGHDDLAAGFRRSLATEDVHLDSIRRWLTSHASAQARRETPTRGLEAEATT